MTIEPRPRRARSASAVRKRAVAAIALLVLVLASSCGGDDGPVARGPSRNATPIPAPKGANDPLTEGEVDHPQVPAASAVAAVDAYSNAESTGDFATSWSLLSSDDRDEIGSFEAWRQQHSVSPRFTGSQLVSSGPGPVVTEATFEPRVDEAVGVIAGSARITWATTEENGGFTIDRSATRSDAHYPSDERAPLDANAWLTAVRSKTVPTGYRGTLIGLPSLRADLAKAKGPFRPTRTMELADWTTPVLVTNAFGPAASTWARIVRFEGPTDFDAVMAPLGERWVVVGLVPV